MTKTEEQDDLDALMPPPAWLVDDQDETEPRQESVDAQ